MSAGVIERCASDGYRARCAGALSSANPYRPETLGGTAWAFGWNVANILPPVLRRLVKVTP